MRRKIFETLIKTIFMPLYANMHPNPIYFLLFSVSCLPQNLILECFISLPLPDPCMMMSE